MVKPSSKLPLKDLMRYMAGNMCPPKMFADYAHNIVSVEAYDLVFEHELQYTRFPQLRRLMLLFSVYEEFPVPDLRSYFRNEGHRLVELLLYQLYDIQIGVLSNLKVLKFGPEASISGAEPLPKLLPNLIRVRFGHEDYRSENTKAVENMTANDTVFPKVVSLELHEKWGLSTEESEMIMIKMAKCFPNLRKFEWTTIPDLERLTPVIQILFSKQENLSSLRLVFRNATSSGIFRLLTNLSVEEIPADKERWSDSLEDPKGTICNLKNLKSLSLEIKDYGWGGRVMRLGDLTSQFLLNAVFLRMKSLGKIFFGHIGYDAECIRAWQEAGREFETVGVKTEEEELAIQSEID